jgi:hypothetical protein
VVVPDADGDTLMSYDDMLRRVMDLLHANNPELTDRCVCCVLWVLCIAWQRDKECTLARGLVVCLLSPPPRGNPNACSTRKKLKPPQVMRVGTTRTAWVNFDEICGACR